MIEHCASKGTDYSPIGVMLLLDTKTEATCGQFANLTYQQLLTYVLEPVLAISMPPAGCPVTLLPHRFLQLAIGCI